MITVARDVQDPLILQLVDQPVEASKIKYKPHCSLMPLQSIQLLTCHLLRQCTPQRVIDDVLHGTAFAMNRLFDQTEDIIV